MCTLSNIITFYILSLCSAYYYFYYWQEIPPCFNFYIVTPNGSEVNRICESLNYQCLSHGLGNEANDET